MKSIDEARTKRLYDIATAFHLLSETPKDEAYFRGYLTGLRRRKTGGVKDNDIEAEAFAELAKKPDTVSRQLGLGYKDGLAGVEIVAGEG
jgi:hypothetical protein